MVLLSSPLTYKFIALWFNCDHSSVIYQERKVHIRSVNPAIPIVPKIPKPETLHPILRKERVGSGKTYAEYAREQFERQRPTYLPPELWG